MILFVGQVARGMRGREAFQEIDYAQVFGGLAKWAAEIADARRIPELVTRAFHVALSGRPGPVVLALPEDMLRDEVDVGGLAPAARSAAQPGGDELARMRALLAEAERPLMILGGSGWDDDACEAVRRFAERNALATACSFRRQTLFDNRDPRYAGDLGLGPNPALAARVRDADVILAVGGRLGETPTRGYTLIEAPRPKQRLIHVHADPDELGRVFQPVLAINAGPAEFARALDALEPISSPRWTGWCEDARRDYETWRTSCASSTNASPKTRSSATAPGTSRRGCTASFATNASARSSRRRRAPWATVFPRRSRRSCGIPSGRWSRSPATATS